MSCGRRGFWRVTHASTDRRRGTNVSLGWFKARCARSSARKEIKPHKRCATIWNVAMQSSKQKIAEVLCVYREVKVLKRAAAKSRKAIKRVAIVSYDEKPESRPSQRQHPDLPPKPGVHATFARDYEYKRRLAR